MNKKIQELEEKSEEFYLQLEKSQTSDEMEKLFTNYIYNWQEIFETTKKGYLSPEFEIEKHPFNIEESDELCRNLTTIFLLINNKTSLIDSLSKNGFEIDEKLKRNYTSLIDVLNYLESGDLFELKTYILSKNPDFKFTFTFDLLFEDVLFKYFLLKNDKIAAIKQLRISKKENISFFDVNLLLKDDKKFMRKAFRKAKKILKIQLESDFIDLYSLPAKDTFEKLLLEGYRGQKSLQKYYAGSNTKLYAEYDPSDEIPVYLGQMHFYHSIFICPILKQYCNHENPPMYLCCGHVISKSAVENLSKNDPQCDFKCPYCPNICNLNTSIEIKL